MPPTSPGYEQQSAIVPQTTSDFYQEAPVDVCGHEYCLCCYGNGKPHPSHHSCCYRAPERAPGYAGTEVPMATNSSLNLMAVPHPSNGVYSPPMSGNEYEGAQSADPWDTMDDKYAAATVLLAFTRAPVCH